MEEIFCCFIGHREIETTEDLIDRLYSTLKNLIVDKKVNRFIFGSESRFDSLCHEIVTALKESYPHVKRISFPLPSEYSVFENELSEKERLLSAVLKKPVKLRGFESVFKNDELKYAGKASYVERNNRMIDRSDYCVFYYDPDYLPKTKKTIGKSPFSEFYPSRNSGTKSAYLYALKKHKCIINLFKKIT